ncbi:MAG: TadE/TadG family type IV pilus assembly protein [Bdellovibrionota bacterium]
MKKNFMRRKKDEAGQAIVEFLVVCAVIFTMIFLFVQIAWGIAYGHFAHYATFMAARAYLSAGIVRQDQEKRAGQVLGAMLKTTSGGKDILPMVAKARGGGDRDAKGAEPVIGAMVGTHPEALARPHNRAYSWAEGVQYNYDLNLFLLPIAGFMKNDGEGKTISGGTPENPTKGVEWKGRIPMASDSFLGREPSTDECFQEMTNFPTRGGIAREDGNSFIEDNGC